MKIWNFRELSEPIKADPQRAANLARHRANTCTEIVTTLRIFDNIDLPHHGFSDEELDFIVNYDIKYRMGPEAEDGG